MTTFRFEVVTPERTVVQGDVEYVLLPGKNGEFGVLANHAPLMVALDIGVLEFGERGSKRQKAALGGGFAEMNANKLVIMVSSAELAEEIDVLRAQEAKERAERRLAIKQDDIDYARAKSALQKALTRIKIANGKV